MAITLENASAYVLSYCLDVRDWEIADDAKRQRFLNVSERVLTDEFPELIVPDEAVYEYANALCITFNDTNRLQKHGIGNFTINGLGSFEFRDRMIEDQGSLDYRDYIPKSAIDLINKANGIDVSSNRNKVKWTGI